MSNILHINVLLHIRPGTETILREAIAAVALPTQAEPGCLRYVLLQDTASATHFILLEEWVDTAAFQSHIDSAHFHACQKILAPIWAAPPVIALLHRQDMSQAALAA